MIQQELELPQGWAETNIGIICKNHDKQRIPINAKKRKLIQGKIPYYGASGIVDYVEKPIFSGKYFLIGEDGANLISRSTPIGFIVEGDFWVNNHAHILSTYENIPLEFLSHYIASISLKPWISGTAQPKLNQENLQKIPVPLPPLNEQKRIVSKIEELLSKIDSAKQSLEHVKLQLEQYRASLLKSAFEGKLTEEWRKENNIDKNYENNPLGDLILFSKNGFSGKPNALKKGTPRLGIETITQSDSIYVNENMHKFIEIPKSKIDTYRAKIGDLFACRQNGNLNSVGKCAIFKEIISPMIFSDSLIQFRINLKLIFPVYLAFFINSYQGRRQIEKFCSTTAGNFSINGTNLKKTIVTYPSLLEQQQIVSQIEQGFSLIQNTTQIVESSLQNLQTMKTSVLKQAFEGKLVPQDPNDEPASVLLERIKSTKESQSTKQRGMKNVK